MSASTCELNYEMGNDNGVPFWVWIIVAIVGFLVVLTIILAVYLVM